MFWACHCSERCVGAITPTPTPTSTPTLTATATATPLTTTRVITYAYDGLQRLIGAVESPGTSYAYGYDLAGNRTGVWLNGTRTVTQTYNAADQVDGYSYDAAGNLANDGITTYGYDALGRMITRGSTTYRYNGDGILIYDGTTRYTQDLAVPLTQILQTTQGSATTMYLYGLDRLASVAGSMRTWYDSDALGSVRLTLSDSGGVLGILNYDPWGTVESGIVPTFGFTGELQDTTTGLVNLRARWYSTGQGRFTARDPFAGISIRPQTIALYPYAENAPVNAIDPSGNLAIFIAGANNEYQDPNVIDEINTPGVWIGGREIQARHPQVGEVVLASWSSMNLIREKILEVHRSCSNEPIILVGHSLGGAVAMAVSRTLSDDLWANASEQAPIDLLVTIDPVNSLFEYSAQNWYKPGDFLFPQWWMYSKSSNVQRQLNLVQDFEAVGQALGSLAKQANLFLVQEDISGAENITIPGVSHTQVDDAPKTWEIIEKAVDELLSKDKI